MEVILDYYVWSKPKTLQVLHTKHPIKKIPLKSPAFEISPNFREWRRFRENNCDVLLRKKMHLRTFKFTKFTFCFPRPLLFLLLTAEQ